MLSEVLVLRGKPQEAETFMRKDLRLSSKILGTDHPHSLVAAGRLAQLLVDRDEYEEAEQILRQTLESDEATLMLREQLVASRHAPLQKLGELL